MTDGQALVVVLLVLYLNECVHWLRSGWHALTTPSGKRWRLRSAGSRARDKGGHLVIANPLPPLGRYLQLPPLPVAISADGISRLLPVHRHADGSPAVTAWSFEEITSVAVDGLTLRLNDTPFVVCGTQRQARYLEALVSRLIATPAAAREQAVRNAFKALFDSGDTRLRLEEWRELGGRLRFVGNLMLVFVFLITPLAVRRYGLEPAFIPAALGFVLLGWSNALLFFLAHRRLLPECGGERAVHLAKMLLCPPIAIRAHDALSANLFSATPPLVLALELLDADDAAELAQDQLRQLHHPLHPHDMPALAAGICQWHHQEWRELTEHLLAQRGLLPVLLVQPPTAPDHGAHAYCPRCHAQFSTLPPECPDCPGVTPVAFPHTARHASP